MIIQHRSKGIKHWRLTCDLKKLALDRHDERGRESKEGELVVSFLQESRNNVSGDRHVTNRVVFMES